MKKFLESLNSRFELLGRKNQWAWKQINKDCAIWKIDSKKNKEKCKKPEKCGKFVSTLTYVW